MHPGTGRARSGAYIGHAKTVWGYRRIVLVGCSGGGSLALFYQSQAERPDITHTPAGDPVDLTQAGLIPADAVIFQAAHTSRAGDPAHKPNPSLGPIAKAPFYALPLYPSDVGTVIGLKTDAHSRALNIDGAVIPGLYAAGLDMNSALRGTCPGAGSRSDFSRDRIWLKVVNATNQAGSGPWVMVTVLG